ncbi:MAG: ATP-dependent Zn protease [Stigonema ocellatum SAG 48.90 = DSM 106950]|nr:ATP-dependent Zn protease [Stigonema ocellatum SAG 48.90 = DSM 106950]
MSKTSLNLIAISVFLMTTTVLLGPLFHLSPTVPALATFTILAIATFDNFSFQGKGGHLLLDWIGSFSSSHRERILHHEAGHFLVAYLLNIPVCGYTLSAWEAMKQKQPGLGGVSFDDGELVSQLERGTIGAQILDRYCTIWMAGIVAETLVFKNAEGGADDQSKLAGVLTSLGFSESACEQKQRLCALQAKTLLQENWTSYQALVNAMRQRATVTECQSAINTEGVGGDSLKMGGMG